MSTIWTATARGVVDPDYTIVGSGSTPAKAEAALDRALSAAFNQAIKDLQGDGEPVPTEADWRDGFVIGSAEETPWGG